MSGPPASLAMADGTDDDDHLANGGLAWAGGLYSTEEPTSPSDDEHDTPPPPPADGAKPVQKRRRVTRACDECRRKKIKCDGKQPCTHCTVYSYDCTYDQPSNRRRNPAPQYIEAIENRLHRAETLLKTVLPNVDLNDPDLLARLSPSGSSTGAPNPLIPLNVASVGQSGAPQPPAPGAGDGACAELDPVLESMIQHTGSLELDERGCYDFHGHSSGMVFLQRLREQFGDLMGAAEGHGSALAKPRHFTPPPQVLDSPRSPPSQHATVAGDSPSLADSSSAAGSASPLADLPDKAVARQYCESALDDALALMRFVHRPTFFALFDRVFDVPLEAWGNEEHRALPLVYAVMSVGTMFAADEHSRLLTEGYPSLAEQGYRFFRASRQLMDIAESRDLPSLQAIICMILFLQSTAKLSTCWSYVGIALHSAIRMGLHRSLPRRFNPIEAEIRKRVFWQIRKMDIYVGAMLGLPTMLSDDDIDQDEPLDVDDECLTVDAVLPMPPARVPLMAATNAHLRLVRILQKIMRYIYPIKNPQHLRGHTQSYVIGYGRIREIEGDLQEWMENLPMSLRPGGQVSPRMERVQQLLRMSYAYLQMFLYRPFLHYVSRSRRQAVNDKRSYACAAACVSVSRNVIHITTEMNQRGLLIGAYWFVMYTTLLAIISLVFYIVENPDISNCQELLKDAVRGKEVLASLARRSIAADRCTQTLASLFSQLPERLRNRPRHLAANSAAKKRHAPSPSPGPRQSSPLPTDGAADADPNPSHVQSQRAATFPTKPSSSSLRQEAKSHTIPLPQQPARPHAPTPNAARRATPEVYPSPPDPHSNTTTDIPSLDDLSIPQLSVPPAAPGTSAAPPAAPFSVAADLPTDLAAADALPADPAAINDLSALMFPSPDPFAYPKQPMTSFDASHQAHFPAADAETSLPPQAFFGDASQAAAAPGLQMPSRAPDNLLEAQLYGPLPYLLPEAAAGRSGAVEGGGFEGGFDAAMGLDGADGADLMGDAPAWGGGLEAWQEWNPQDFAGGGGG